MTEQKNNGKCIAGVGSALVDMLIHESDAFLEKTDISKGGMTLVESEVIDNALAESSNQTQIVSGGSACNTIVGIGQLGACARFVGKLGEDELGRLFRSDLHGANVEPVILTSPTATGKVLSVITPDAQRSMLTYLGAASELKPEDIDGEAFKQAEIVHVEGYLVFNRDLILAAFDAARQSGAKISLDLASYTVVESSLEFLRDIVKDYVDILIANEDEAAAYTGYTDEEKAIKTLADQAEIAVLKVGKKGSYVASGGAVAQIDVAGTEPVVDTTGAGDLWASGFLYGLVNGWPMDKCGRLGSICGYEVCRVVGAHIPESGWARIRNGIQTGTV